MFEAEAREARAGSTSSAQGTLYPDVIESVSVVGPVGDDQEPPQRRRPARADAVQAGRAAARAVQGRSARASAASSGLDEEFVVRQPFPGPGPGRAHPGRGDAGAARPAAARRRDRRRGSASATGWYARLWQSFAVLLPVQSVGVMGDERTYEYTVAIRAVESRDGMTADWARLPHDLLGAHLVAHRQRGARHQPRRLRHQLEAAVDDRVGMRHATHPYCHDH